VARAPTAKGGPGPTSSRRSRGSPVRWRGRRPQPGGALAIDSDCHTHRLDMGWIGCGCEHGPYPPVTGSAIPSAWPPVFRVGESNFFFFFFFFYKKFGIPATTAARDMPGVRAPSQHSQSPYDRYGNRYRRRASMHGCDNLSHIHRTRAVQPYAD
jgi:hypothetical protein